jgi:hypothetical protein
MFIGQFKPMMAKEPGQEEKGPEEGGEKEKPPEAARSNSSEEFLKTPEAKEFVSKWSGKMKEGKPVVTKRGVTEMLGTLHRNSNLSDKEVMKETDRVLLRLTGLDGFSSTINSLKAKAEGIFKGLKQAIAGG